MMAVISGASPSPIIQKGSPDKKPGMYIDGNIHSNEVQGTEFLYTPPGT